MKQFIKSSMLIALVWAQTTQGQTTKPSASTKLPGDTTLPSSQKELSNLAANEKDQFSYRVEDYFSKPQTDKFQLSPNGEFISFLQKDAKGQRGLYVKTIKTGVTIKVLTEEKELIFKYSWFNNNRIIYIQDKGGDENYHLFTINKDGKGAKA